MANMSSPVLITLFVIVIYISIPGIQCEEQEKQQQDLKHNHDPCCTNQHCVRAYYDHNYDRWHITHGYCESSHYKHGGHGSYGSSHHGSNSNGHYSSSGSYDHNHCYYDGCLFTGLCYYDNDYKTNATKTETVNKVGEEKAD